MGTNDTPNFENNYGLLEGLAAFQSQHARLLWAAWSRNGLRACTGAHAFLGSFFGALRNPFYVLVLRTLFVSSARSFIRRIPKSALRTPNAEL